MKIILTGSTGFVGSEVLNQCLRNPAIDSIIALSRRKLPDTISNSKLKVFLMDDFAMYPQSVVEEIRDADACIWCMGTTSPNRTLEVDYPLAFTTALTTAPLTKPFRHIHLSGAMTERDQTTTLWFKSEMRKMKGETENHLLALPTSNPLWHTLIIKSGFVIQPTLKSPRDLMGWLLGEASCIKVDELAAAMIDAATRGWGEDPAMTWDDTKIVAAKGRGAIEECGSTS